MNWIKRFRGGWSQYCKTCGGHGGGHVPGCPDDPRGKR